MQETMKKLIFLQNLESSIETIINSTSNTPTLPTEESTISISRDRLDRHMMQIDDQNLNEGTLIENNDPQINTVTILATDASRGESGSRSIASIACAFNMASCLNLAAPSIYSTSTEILELEAIMMGLNQAKENNITSLHIISDNTSALRFLKESIKLGMKSRYIQEKVNYNSFFQTTLDNLNSIKTSFKYLSTSHIKSHTSNKDIFSMLNSRADALAKAKLQAMSKLLQRADRQAADADAADTPIV